MVRQGDAPIDDSPRRIEPRVLASCSGAVRQEPRRTRHGGRNDGSPDRISPGMRANSLLRLGLLGLGGVLGVGAIGEIVLALDPGLLPAEATVIPFMAAHQTSWALRTWVFGSNVVNLICAVTLVRATIAIGRGQARGWRQLRVATGAVGIVALAGVLVCLPYLLPLPVGAAGEGSTFMLVSVVSAGIGLATLSLLLARFAQRTANQQSLRAEIAPIS
ncbi:hypothetical protein BH11MYX1_BH11MYX1_51490 [soil metagenome]